MNLEEIATKADLAAMEKRIIQALATQKIEKKKNPKHRRSRQVYQRQRPQHNV